MLYHLFVWLREQFNMSGAGVFQYISFRAGMAVILSLIITLVFGKRLIHMLRRKQIGETVRDLGLAGEKQKSGTPTMGGIIIIGGILVPTLLFADVKNVYVWMMLLSTIWLGLVGFLDDYIKVFKKNKDGLSGRFKVLGQIGLGLIIGYTMYFNNDIVVTREIKDNNKVIYNNVEQVMSEPYVRKDQNGAAHTYVTVKTPNTTVPFSKNHEFSYAKLASYFGENAAGWLTPTLYILFAIFIITAVSNGANITDGMDGLATGISAIAGLCFGIFAYLSGNYVFSEYLNIMHIPNLGELSIFVAAFVGACIGFLWYNVFPAQVFMGDTGSLALGGIIASLALIVRKELLIPIICGIFLIENLSVIIQVYYFKYTKKKYGEGRRIFLMSPLHHHYQLKGYHESKITARFWIIGIILSILSVVSLKLQ